MNDLFNQNIPTIKDRDMVARGDSNVKIFENVTFGKIRTILKDGEPLFCLSDIAKVLEIQNGSDIKNALLREFELPRLNLYSFDTGFGIKEFSMITESQLYFVLMRSNSAKAKPFRQWVVGEVLPCIRKTGSYSISAPKLPQSYAEALRELADNVERVAELENKIAIDKPKVEYAEAILSADNSQSIGDFAKFLATKGVETGQNRFFNWLKANHYLQSDNMPYQKYVDCGYFELLQQSYKRGDKRLTTYKTLITPKGQHYFTLKLQKSA